MLRAVHGVEAPRVLHIATHAFWLDGGGSRLLQAGSLVCLAFNVCKRRASKPDSRVTLVPSSSVRTGPTERLPKQMDPIE